MSDQLLHPEKEASAYPIYQMYVHSSMRWVHFVGFQLTYIGYINSKSVFHNLFAVPPKLLRCRPGLSNGQTGQLPRAPRFDVMIFFWCLLNFGQKIENLKTFDLFFALHLILGKNCGFHSYLPKIS